MSAVTSMSVLSLNDSPVYLLSLTVDQITTIRSRDLQVVVVGVAQLQIVITAWKWSLRILDGLMTGRILLAFFFSHSHIFTRKKLIWESISAIQLMTIELNLILSKQIMQTCKPQISRIGVRFKKRKIFFILITCIKPEENFLMFSSLQNMIMNEEFCEFHS